MYSRYYRVGGMYSRHYGGVGMYSTVDTTEAEVCTVDTKRGRYVLHTVVTGRQLYQSSKVDFLI